MTEQSWATELSRFRGMTQIDQLLWLSRFLFFISMLARGTYEAGTEGVTKPAHLRRFNELIHRIANFQMKVATASPSGMPDEIVFALIECALVEVDVSSDEMLRLLR